MGAFFVWAFSLVHCVLRRDLSRERHSRAVRAVWFAVLFVGAAAPQPLTISRSVINGAHSATHLHWEDFFPKPLSDTKVVELGGHSTWQFYHGDRVILTRMDGSPLVDMESQSLVIPLWFLLALLIYWSSPWWLPRMQVVTRHVNTGATPT